MELVVFERESRTSAMYYGVDDRGIPRRVGQLLLREVMDAWPLTAATPTGPAQILKASRGMVLTSLVVYEQLTLAIFISLLAVEASLRARLVADELSITDKNGRDLGWAALVSRATAHGLIQRNPDEHGRDLWDYGRLLRNRFAHPEAQQVMTYAAALPMIETSHRLVSEVFP